MELSQVLYSAAIAVVLCISLGATDVAASVGNVVPADDARAVAESVAERLAADLARLCPVAPAGDQAAFDKCRKGLFQDSLLKASLADLVLWGRQRDPKLALKDAKLTQFDPDVLAGMYAPLFMFNGKYTVEYTNRESMFQIRLQAAFRNRLQPGQFPYPFWHEAEKWSMYERANDIILWWDPKLGRVRVAQFTVFGAHPSIQANEHVAQAPFDGQWRWTDAQGKSQPAVTVFDGLLSDDNPYKAQLDDSYKTFALKLRDGQCFECHVPDNPDGMKKLVLLQTPMHAAAEIKRVLKSVREDSMPRNEFGMETPLDAKIKDALLTEGAAFERVLEQAKAWEKATMRNAAAAVKAKGPATP